MAIVNKATAKVPSGFVALFIGATSGIGLATLQALCKGSEECSIYVVGRSRARFESERSRLQRSNAKANISFIEAEVTLLSQVDKVCKMVASVESRLDLLFMSPGYLGVGGPHYSSEGTDTCLALSVYCRMRFVQRMLPQLQAARRPRVVSVLAGGHERILFARDGDLGLTRDNGRNYNALRAVDQATTLHTLAFIHLASQNPHIAFLHTHPGWVSTSFLANLLTSMGAWARPLAYIVLLLWRVFALSVEESGRRHADFCNSATFPSRESIKAASFDSGACATCHTSCSGLYLVLPDGRTSTNRRVLAELEKDGWPEQVWDFLEKTFAEALEKS